MVEEKQRDIGALTTLGNSPGGSESPASEPTSTRRRGGAHKRKANALSASSNSLPTPSKRMTREKAMLISNPILHNGPLTRARQAPNSLASGSGLAPAQGSAGWDPGSSVKGEMGFKVGKDGLKPEEVDEMNKASKEWEALEAKIQAEFEVIRSRDSNAHAVPVHCGWFSWTKIHPLEELSMPSFFKGKSETRTRDVYMEIRNWIMKKFHANPNLQIELKDLSELEVGDLDARQEVLEFLDYWGLINFHPFPPTESDVAGVDSDPADEKNLLIKKLYQFEEVQSLQPVIPKHRLMTPTTPSRLFPESAITDDSSKQEGPSVEYHCNSCSADCSRKRYHCQKQADFDLCSECFSNRKFGSNMSSSDFIIMEPAEAPGVAGGKWTDQETLLLLEALELYKENWNEIAEHVATKTKAQCILHFVQMPIEDTFFDSDDDMDANSKETAAQTAADDTTCRDKDVPEKTEDKPDANDGQQLTSATETPKTEDASEVKECKGTPLSEEKSEAKNIQETPKLDDTNEVKRGQETGQNLALKALSEAFEAVGYPLPPEGHFSFADAGNPVMTLASFLTKLASSEVVTASARASLNSISGNSPGLQLAARHCFLLEDFPDDGKESATSERVLVEKDKDEKLEDNTLKMDSIPSANDKDLVNDQGDQKIQDSFPEEKRPQVSFDTESSAKLNASEEPEKLAIQKEVERDKLVKSNEPGSQKNHVPSNIEELNDSATKRLPSPCNKSEEETSTKEVIQPIESPKVVVTSSDCLPIEKNENCQLAQTKSVGDSSPPTETVKDIVMTDSQFTKKNELKDTEESSQPTEVQKDVEMGPDTLTSQQPAVLNSVPENKEAPATGNDQSKDCKIENCDNDETKDDHMINNMKRAAVSTLSAAAVKAKLFADHEEEQIRQIAVSVIEKQLYKLETKLGFFHDLDNVMMRVREPLERSRQRLYNERAQIIAKRLGIPASSARPMVQSSPTNRMAANFSSSVPRPPIPMVMTSLKPPIPRPVAPSAPTTNPSVSSTATRSSVQPSGS